jgi:protein TonB
VAGLLHVAALWLPLPSGAEVEIPELPTRPPIALTEFEIPPPSTPAPERPSPRQFVRKVPLPAPEPLQVEPLSEPTRSRLPELEPEGLPNWIGAGPAPPAPSAGPVDERALGLERPEPLPGRAEPAYPEGARRIKLQGVVVLQALITESGDVESIEVVRETHAGAGFGDAAVDAVSTWKYRPGRIAGRPVAVLLTVVVEFKLR